MYQRRKIKFALLLVVRKGKLKETTMKRLNLPLAKLSIAQKLDIMETLWDDLTRDEKKLDSPIWHEDILKNREEALSAGQTTVSDWEDAKKRIRKNIS